MDFERVLKSLLTAFERNQIRYAAIGGFGLGLLGFKRATMDLDFLIHRDDLGRLDDVLTELGYRRFVRTENASHYRHTNGAWGALDFIHGFRGPSVGMLDRVKQVPFLEGCPPIKVVQPEDLIGFKVQAIANQPSRRTQDHADIARLIQHYQGKLDWDRIQEYYELFEMGEEGRKLQERFGHAE